MKKIDLGQSIGILANLGVIAGIVFLAVEIGQNEAALDEQNAIKRQSSSTSIQLLAGDIARSKNLNRCWDEQKGIVIARGYGAFVDSVDASRNAE